MENDWQEITCTAAIAAYLNQSFKRSGCHGYSDAYNYNGIYALIGRQEAFCENMNISFGRAYFTEHAIAVRANKSSDTMFLFYVLDKMKLGQYSGQSAQAGLAVNKLIELSAFVSTLPE